MKEIKDYDQNVTAEELMEFGENVVFTFRFGARVPFYIASINRDDFTYINIMNGQVHHFIKDEHTESLEWNEYMFTVAGKIKLIEAIGHFVKPVNDSIVVSPEDFETYQAYKRVLVEIVKHFDVAGVELPRHSDEFNIPKILNEYVSKVRKRRIPTPQTIKQRKKDESSDSNN